MIAIKRTRFRISELMDEFGVGLDDMARSTGVDESVLEAMADQRYTPSLDQRKRVARMFGLRCDQIMWGHATLVQSHIHAPI